MKKFSTLAAIFALALGFAARAADQPFNTLSDAEKAAGWRLLWDGKTLNGWRSFKKPGPPATGWEIKDGMLVCAKAGKGGDIITTDKDIHAPLDVVVAGVTKFAASAGAFKGHKAIQVQGPLQTAPKS